MIYLIIFIVWLVSFLGTCAYFYMFDEYMTVGKLLISLLISFVPLLAQAAALSGFMLIAVYGKNKFLSKKLF